MGFSRDGGAYTIARLLATRLASKDLGSQTLRRKPDKTPIRRQLGRHAWRNFSPEIIQNGRKQQ